MTTALPKAAFALVAMTVVTARAQFATTPSAGTLGQRYVEARVSRTKPADDDLVFDRKNVGAIAFNLPVASAIDLDFGGTVGKTRGRSVPGMLASSIDYTRRERTAIVGATAYLRRGVVAPFARLAGVYESSKEKRVWGPRATIPGGQVEDRDDSTSWTFRGGAEVLLGRVAITPAVEYFDSDRDVYSTVVRRGWIYGVEAQLWLTKSVGGFVNVEHTRANGDYSYRAWSWDAGVRFRF